MQKTPNQRRKDELLQELYSWLETEASEDTRERFKQAIIEKELGIQLPPRPTVEEILLEEALEEDPEFRRQYRQQLLEKLGFERANGLDSIDQLIANSRKMKEIQELLGDSSDGWQGLKEAVPAVFELLEAFTKARSSGALGGTASVTPIQHPVEEATPPEPAVTSAGDQVPDTRPISPATQMAPTTPPDIPPPPSSSAPPKSPLQPLPEALDAKEGNIDLTDLLSTIDWDELERGVHGDPNDFMEQVQGSPNGENDGSQVLANLFKDHEPSEILDVLNWAVDSCVRDGRGEDYEVAVLVLMHLTETEAGREWLVKAHAAAKALTEK